MHSDRDTWYLSGVAKSLLETHYLPKDEDQLIFNGNACVLFCEPKLYVHLKSKFLVEPSGLARESVINIKFKRRKHVADGRKWKR